MLIEPLEGRRLLAASIWNRFGELAIANADALPNAPAVPVYRNRRRIGSADQIVFSRDVAPGGRMDYRQHLVIDSNGEQHDRQRANSAVVQELRRRC